MKTRELQRIWWDWLSTAERLNRSLAEQQAALTVRDTNRIEAIQPEIESMMALLNEIDQNAVAMTKQLAGKLEAQPTLRSIVAALPEAEARQFDALANRLRVVGSNLQERIERNRLLIENELTYVGGSLFLIAKAAQEQEGDFATSTPGPVLVNQVA